MTFSQYFSGIFKGIGSLLKGMRVTIGVFAEKKVTQQYPENRNTLVLPPRVRGKLVMPHDGNNEHACTACGICQMNCPNGTINVVSEMQEIDGKKKRVLVDYFYNLGQCTFCNLCVLTCPSSAIKFSNEFENSVFQRPKLKEKLNNAGSKLREKKIAPKTTDIVQADTTEAEVNHDAVKTILSLEEMVDEKGILIENYKTVGQMSVDELKEKDRRLAMAAISKEDKE